MALHPVPSVPRPPETEADKVRARVKAAPKPRAMVQCHRCGGREVIETKTGVMQAGRTWSGGTKTLLCFNCMLEGKRTVLI